MNDIGTHLRAGDPLIDDPAMSPAEIDAMRRAIVGAATESAASPSWFPPLLAVAATAAALTVAVFGADRLQERSGPASRHQATPTTAAQDAGVQTAASGRRQLQFATPGGTRVIWVFDPEFNP